VSVSPHGDFVGPESSDLWPDVFNKTEEPYLIVRPASLSLRFKELASLWKSHSMIRRTNRPNAQILNATFYMEYYPLNALNPKLLNDIKKMPFTNFLSTVLQLLWMGGGDDPKNGRLHFDRYENIFVMLAGML
jgi:hypothetical protein